MEFRPGDTLLVKDPRPWDERYHLYIIITDPHSHESGLMLLPCVVSLVGHAREHSCILHTGDHPFIKHSSEVNFRQAIVISHVGLARLIEKKEAKVRENIAAETLDRIIEAARTSPQLAPEKRAMLPPRKL